MMRSVDLSNDNIRLGELGTKLLRGGLSVAFVGLAVSLFLALSPSGGGKRFFISYLHNYFFFLTLALGSLFFVLIQHVTSATWSVPVRRLAEGIAATVGLLFVLAVPVLLGLPELYHWADPSHVAHDALLQWKQPFLNERFFLIRVLFYFAVWIGLTRWFMRRSTEQDRTGDPALTLRMKRAAAPGLLLFGLTLTYASFDLIMSLDAHWFSTMFGVYAFAGSAVGGFALLVLAVLFVQRTGRLTHTVGSRHFYDLGNFLFAFTVFWAYIAYSQYMLIWYGNIPEETSWYQIRSSGSWGGIGLLLLFGHFVLPFLALMPRYSKRRRGTVGVVAAWLLLMHWFDLYWVALPVADPEGVSLHLLDLTCFVMLGGLFVAGAAWSLRGNALVPERDPRLEDSLQPEGV